MVTLETADLYVAVDILHEKNWMPQVAAARPDMPILHLQNTTTTRTIAGRKDASGNEMVDPHIWLAAPQLRDIAAGIRQLWPAPKGAGPGQLASEIFGGPAHCTRKAPSNAGPSNTDSSNTGPEERVA